MNDELFERLPQGDSGAQTSGNSQNEGVANWLRSRCCPDVQEPEGELTSPHGLLGRENQLAELYAIDHGIWIDDPYKLWAMGPNGDENECFVGDNGANIYKVNLLTHSHGSILEVFDKISVHNTLFPDTFYEFVGFTNMGYTRSAFPIFRQSFVKNARQATLEQIGKHMTTLGFHSDKAGHWRNEQFHVWDLWPKNVLVDVDENIYVIDAELEIL